MNIRFSALKRPLAFAFALLLATGQSLLATVLVDQAGNRYEGEIDTLLNGEISFTLADGSSQTIQVVDLTSESRAAVENWAARNPDKVDVHTRVDEPPVPTRTVAPVVPPELRRQNLSGMVSVAVIINERGQVIDSRINRSNQPEFDQLAVDAVRQWRFQPGKKDGQPVKVRVIIPLRFNS
ncbi:MAG: energy transducer TonB [Puniceicoccaceae bacterium]|nr:MAG: energy transducer TonB [Puniceicoccaceae bacterium]